MSQKIKHVLTVACLIPYVLFAFYLTSDLSWGEQVISDPVKEYGILGSIVLYVIRCMLLLPLMMSACNLFGISYFNSHPKKPVLRSSLMFGPFLCFRVVTRGTYPELVKQNVQRNIETCFKLGLANFVFEVATDRHVGMKKSSQVREIVVPDKYRTKNGTLYKARALQYCLEEEVNILSDNDWIIHLDEETLVTENCLIGIINFINDGQYEFGQGVITYANEEIVNWITTMADFIRVALDYGLQRFSLGFLHRPLFSWKGSFNVSNAGAERHVTFDFGKEGSIAEDCYFAMMAWKEGYKFGWVEGEMWEKSTFTVLDYIKQRKRWYQGINLVLRSKRIPTQLKGGIGLLMLCWTMMPITPMFCVILIHYPLPNSVLFAFLFSLMAGTMLFLFFFGMLKSYPLRGRKLIGLFFVLVLLFIPQITAVLETIPVIWSIFSAQKDFHVVSKEMKSSRGIHIV
ncbi:hypothetical protein LOTGIDRAFT_122782 [Lottia gigantea]|uniref:Glycosyltransferase 2-like domain-containing protein n=1 Tax=Lottia gigantea TaxID=225164 RepID=V4BNV8_LOTGI|nr:hypothetical protein LOTGIDRAFT_122782 [Lottia gigantea]ESO90594.1 hypothetical protein LOTGIDRAFT_122782 [Lottia gigantea]